MSSGWGSVATDRVVGRQGLANTEQAHDASASINRYGTDIDEFRVPLRGAHSQRELGGRSVADDLRQQRRAVVSVALGNDAGDWPPGVGTVTVACRLVLPANHALAIDQGSRHA